MAQGVKCRLGLQVEVKDGAPRGQADFTAARLAWRHSKELGHGYLTWLSQMTAGLNAGRAMTWRKEWRSRTAGRGLNLIQVLSIFLCLGSSWKWLQNLISQCILFRAFVSFSVELLDLSDPTELKS